VTLLASQPTRRVPPTLAIIGMGRMGRTIDALATMSGWTVVARLTANEPVTLQSLAGAAVAVEFTTAAAAPDNIRCCVAAGCPVVSGTTGWDAELSAVIEDVQRSEGALLWASNFSIAAHVLGIAAVRAAELLRPTGSYQIALVETHHALKRDAPSGTARKIAASLGAVWEQSVPTTSVRVGHAPGEHAIIFDGVFDQLRLVHAVRDRQVFAEGALTAAAWLQGRCGIFTLADVLELPAAPPAPRPTTRSQEG